ncbi:MAG: hypothetical protein AB1295_01195 [Candidatus Micrarchaeota archaeon]
MHSKRKTIIKSSVITSIRKLLDQARKAASKSPARSKRYVDMAFDLLKKNKVRLPKELRNSFCRKCHLIWIPAKTMTAYYDKKNDCLRVRCRCGATKRL